jgi:hypothetical protein
MGLSTGWWDISNEDMTRGHLNLSAPGAHHNSRARGRLSRIRTSHWSLGPLAKPEIAPPQGVIPWVRKPAHIHSVATCHAAPTQHARRHPTPAYGIQCAAWRSVLKVVNGATSEAYAHTLHTVPLERTLHGMHLRSANELPDCSEQHYSGAKPAAMHNMRLIDRPTGSTPSTRMLIWVNVRMGCAQRARDSLPFLWRLVPAASKSPVD